MTRSHRPLLALLGAVGISGLGTRMSFVAIPWFVLTTTGSATTTGLVAFAEMAPYVAAQALGGPYVDRLGPRRASVATDAVAGALLALVVLLGHAGLLSMPVLALLVAGVGIARGIGDSARSVLVPGVSELSHTALERSSGLYDGASRLSALIGLPLAGALLSVTAATSVLAVDAATFALSAVLVSAAVPATAQPPRAAEREGGACSYVASLRAGLAYLAGDRLLLSIALMVLVTNFVDQAGGAVLFPYWAHRVMHSPVALGLFGAAFSLGAVLGNAAATGIGPRLPRRLTYACGFLLAGAPRFLAVALSRSIDPILAVAFVAGLGAGGINPALGAVEYERVPRPLQARALGAIGALAWAGIPFGSLAAGVAVSHVGLGASLVAAAVVYGLATLAPFVLPQWREMDQRAAPSWARPAAGGQEALSDTGAQGLS